MTKEQLDKLDELLMTDMPITAIAQELGMSYNTFRLRMVEADSGIERRRYSLSARRAEIAHRLISEEIEPQKLTIA